MIFQDPYASLNPSMTVNQTISEFLKIHHIADGKERKQRVKEILSEVEMDPEFLDRYPHEFSGGQRQRISIARALVVNPEFLVADEPVSSLDVSVQAQIINLLQELQEKFKLTYLFISHDLSTVRSLCSRVLVMYLGRVVEMGPVEEIFDHPLHAYTQALLSAIPIPDPKANRQRIILSGEPPSLTRLPPGCGFAERCRFATLSCREEEPELYDAGAGHFVACRNAVGTPSSGSVEARQGVPEH